MRKGAGEIKWLKAMRHCILCSPRITSYFTAFLLFLSSIRCFINGHWIKLFIALNSVCFCCCFFWLSHAARRISVPQLEMEPSPLAVEAAAAKSLQCSGGQCRSRSGLGLVSVVCTLSTLLFGETGGGTAGLTRQGGEDKERERHVQDFLQIHAHLHAAWSRWSWWDRLVNSLTLSSFTSKTGRRPVPISLRGCELSSERFALRARLAQCKGS